jgi:hypothetical protein
MKTNVFWDVAQSSLAETDRRFREDYSFYHHRPDDGGSKHL